MATKTSMALQSYIGVASRLSLLAFGVALLVGASGCSYRVHVGDHDAGGMVGSCSSDSDCTPGNQCACGRCVSRDLVPSACNPPCDEAREGDSCMGDWACAPRCPSGGFQCVGGVARRVPAACTDAGEWCECPAPPPGCRYDGEPCPCSHMTCDEEPCGPATCTGGTVCCNASCGICTPPGGACLDVECGSCEPMDARGVGACRVFFGYAWDGSSCQGVSGCECSGGNCAALYESQDDCLRARSHCPGRFCGGFGGFACSDTEFCDFEPSDYCGAADAGGVCRPRPGALCEPVPPGTPPVCGCDGAVYASECEAQQAGTDAALGSCGAMGCEPEQARGVGGCAAIVGVVWNGSDCEWISGCSCEGSDCDTARYRLDASAPDAACESEHAHCPRYFP